MSGEIERTVRQGVSVARWLLAPMYLGIGLMLIVLLVQFVREFFRGLPTAFASQAPQVAHDILSLAVILIAGLLIHAVLRTGLQVYAEAAPGDRSEVDFAALGARLFGGAIVLVLVLLVRGLIGGQAAGSGIDMARMAPVFAVLGALVGGRLVLAVANWFDRLARHREDGGP